MSANALHNIEKLEASLWAAADNLRANAHRGSNEYCMPVLGIIFLRHASNRYDAALREIEADQAAGRMPKRSPIKEDFIKRRALMLPQKARYNHLLHLPKGERLGTALVEAMNAIDVPMAQALLAAVQGLAADAGVRAVVLCGAGKAFMAGGDLATLRADPVQGAADLLGPLNAAVQVLAGMNAPVIAKVHGAAAGAGLSLMLQADFVMAAESTRFNLAYINLGTSCDVGASWGLPRLVGLRHALEIALLGDTLSASDALRLGLVNRVVPAEQLD